MIAKLRKSNLLRVAIRTLNLGVFNRIPSEYFAEALNRTTPTKVTVVGAGRFMLVVDVGKGGGISGRRHRT